MYTYIYIYININIYKLIGKNDYGQLCIEGSENLENFTQTLGASEKEKVKQVCCGYYHTLFLSHSGIVTAFGRNDYGQLGLGYVQARYVYVYYDYTSVSTYVYVNVYT
jgi:alpha-tubulin suppressor-like RCC1 family protein